MFRPIPRIEKENKTILYLGSLTKLKGVHVLIKAFKLVQREFKSAELIIGGKRKDYTLFQDIAHQSDIKKHIKFPGFIKDEELPNYYSSCDVFVWPALAGITLSVLDAMACGAPVVINDAFDAHEYIGDAGILVEPGNVQQLADALLYILQNEDVGRIYSQKAINRAERFSWEKMVKETLNLYNGILNKD
jgi:glycosyltransferase involved in cell wall biosynthesis